MKPKKMKKRIPSGTYCEGCPWWTDVWFYVEPDALTDFTHYADPASAEKLLTRMATHPYTHKREECQFRNICDDDCTQCREPVSHCAYLHYTEYGQYPLGDMCKICGVREYPTRREWIRELRDDYTEKEDEKSQ